MGRAVLFQIAFYSHLINGCFVWLWVRTLNGPHSSPRPACAAPHCSSQLSAHAEVKQKKKKKERGKTRIVRSGIKLDVFQRRALARFNTRSAARLACTCRRAQGFLFFFFLLLKAVMELRRPTLKHVFRAGKAMECRSFACAAPRQRHRCQRTKIPQRKEGRFCSFLSSAP